MPKSRVVIIKVWGRPDAGNTVDPARLLSMFQRGFELITGESDAKNAMM